MKSSTKNVKLGICQVFYNGQDLGYTKGGVEVNVQTETKKVEIDQFGKTAINELVMGRNCTVKAPLAETTLENLAATMPGASLVSEGGTVAGGTIVIATNAVNGKTIVVNGATVTFKTAATTDGEVTIGASADATAANLAAALNASLNPLLAAATYSVSESTVTIKYGNRLVYGVDGMQGVEGNSFTLASGTMLTSVTLSGATLSGGADPTLKFVDVNTGTGIDLLTRAYELRLHPQGKADNDLSEDLIIPIAGTSGDLQFSYKVDDERIYPVEFTAYPDPTTKRLFLIGSRG